MMENEAEILINRAESQWLESLEEHVESLFTDRFLPSHDHTHHKRVWNISKRLIREISRSDRQLNYPLVEGVLIAAWFHDLGMIQTTGESHGKEGSEMCREFLMERSLMKPDSMEEIIDAIREHDIKDERIYKRILPGHTPDILTILSIADDLDALGIIGIYRYSEIYIERGMDLKELGMRVLKNANTRFLNLNACHMCDELILSYEKEWKELVSFFEHYLGQLPDSGDPTEILSGPIGVVNHIRTQSMERHVRPERLYEMIPEKETDPYVIQFFSRLRNELENARC
jgi:HD superfamily phosphodiesterase